MTSNVSSPKAIDEHPWWLIDPISHMLGAFLRPNKLPVYSDGWLRKRLLNGLVLPLWLIAMT